MVQEILVVLKEPLTRDMIEEGARFVEALERHNFPFSAAFWLYESDRNQWRMKVAVPKARVEGTLKPLRRLVDITREESVDVSVSNNMAVVDSKDPLVLDLRKALGKRTGVRYADAYVYRATA